MVGHPWASKWTLTLADPPVGQVSQPSVSLLDLLKVDAWRSFGMFRGLSDGPTPQVGLKTTSTRLKTA